MKRCHHCGREWSACSSPWWRWPENKCRGVRPWFSILARCAGLPFMAVGMALTSLGVLLSYGIGERGREMAREVWR